MNYYAWLITRYAKERDAATIAVVEGASLEVFKAFATKWKDLGLYPRNFKLPADEVLEIAIRKMVIHEENAPESTKQKAAKWLLERGYDLNLT